MILNEFVLELMKSYPTDGRHDYYWPKAGSFDGVTRELKYRGESIAQPDASCRTYCCGLTFEVCLRAYELWAEREAHAELDLNLPAADVRKMKADWFVATGKRGGPVDALVPRGLGIKIDVAEDARPGDFVQIWRESGSGHSVIFLGLENGGIRYWSTQPGTKGIGERKELFYGKNWVKKDELYIARAISPAQPLKTAS